MHRERERKAANRLTEAIHRIAPRRLMMGLKSDARLLESFRSGSEEAFLAIKGRYYRPLVAYLELTCATSREEAERTVRDVLERSHTTLRGQSQAESLKSLLYRAVHSSYSGSFRERPASQDLSELEEDSAVETTSSPSALRKRGARSRQLMGELGGLPELQRAVLVLRELHGLSHEEIAAVLTTTAEESRAGLIAARTRLVSRDSEAATECREIRAELVTAADSGTSPNEQARRHLWKCASCRRYRDDLGKLDRRLRLLLPATGVALFGFLPKAFAVGRRSGGGSTGTHGVAGLSTGKLVAGVCCALVALVGIVQMARDLSSGKRVIGSERPKLAFSIPEPPPASEQQTSSDTGADDTQNDPGATADSDASSQDPSLGDSSADSLDDLGSDSGSGSFGTTDDGSDLGSSGYDYGSGDYSGGSSVDTRPRDEPGEQVTVQGPARSPYTVPGGDLLIGKSIRKGTQLSSRIALVTRKLPLLASQAGQEKKAEFSCPGGMVLRSVFSHSDEARSARTRRLELKRVSDYGVSESGDVLYSPAKDLSRDTFIIGGVVCMYPPEIKPEERLKVKHFKVCADALFVYESRDGKNPIGLLVRGEEFDLVNYDNGDGRVYGYAQGDTKEYGWVPVGGLCGRAGIGYAPQAVASSTFERRTVCASARSLRKTPGNGESTGESVYSGNVVRAMRYSSSHAYVYSFKARKFGWIPRNSLCKQGETAPIEGSESGEPESVQ